MRSSQRAGTFTESVIREMTRVAQKYGSINLAQGFPDFPMPDEAHRLRIWQGMFPAEVARNGALDLAALAKRFETSGGEIKNAALASAPAFQAHVLSEGSMARCRARMKTRHAKIATASRVTACAIN